MDAGRTSLYPLFLQSAEYTNNLFYQSEHTATPNAPNNVFAADAFTTIGGLIADIPVSNSKIRVAGMGRNRAYRSEAEAPSTGGWYALVSAELVFSSLTKLNIKDSFEQADLEAQTFRGGAEGVPGSGEIVFTGEPYRRNVATIEVNHPATPRVDLAAAYYHEQLTFLGVNELGFYDLQADSLELRGAHWTTFADSVLWSISARRNSLSRDDGTPPPGGGPPPYLADASTQRGVTAEAGWRREFGPQSAVFARAGGIYVNVQGVTPFTYSGVIGAVEYQRSRPDRFLATVGYYRDVYPSPFTAAAVYVGDTFAVRFATPAVQRFIAGGELSLTRNNYPESQDAERDDIVYAGGWLGYRFVQGLVLRGLVSYSVRNSTNHLRDFDVYRIGTNLTWGF